MTDDLLKTMDDFGSQVSSQLDVPDNSATLIFLTRNIAFRVDRFKSKQRVSREILPSLSPNRHFCAGFHWSHVLPRLSPITCSPTSVTDHMFSRHAYHRSHVLPRLSPITCSPGLVTVHLFSRTCHRSHVLPRLSPINCSPALVTDSCSPVRFNDQLFSTDSQRSIVIPC